MPKYNEIALLEVEIKLNTGEIGNKKKIYSFIAMLQSQTPRVYKL